MVPHSPALASSALFFHTITKIFSFPLPMRSYRQILFISFFVGLFMWGLLEIYKPLAVSIFISYILNKPIGYCEKNLHINRSILALFFIGILVMVFLGLLTFIIPFLHQNIILISQKMPEFIHYINESWWPSLNLLVEKFDINYANKLYQHMQGQLLELSWSILKYMLNRVQDISITSLVYYFLIMPFLVYYLSADWPRITEWVINLWPNKRFHTVLADLDRTFFLYFRGQTMVCGLLTVLYSLALWGIDFRNPIILGLLIGTLSFIPYLGSIFGFLLITLITLAHTTDYFHALLQVCVMFGVLNILENQVLAPRLIGKRLGLPPLILILTIFVANQYFGILGMFFAYPVTAVLVRLIQELWGARLQ